NIHKMNGLKNGLSFALSAISVAVFAVGGLVEWHYALGMMIASTVGGYTGAPIARALPKSFVRGLIAFVGFSMSAIFFWRLVV
ncbi:MAG: sulfite exporter TauE/SafE family protein, partial [Fimbriimonadaceae bacterium]|nr:sulfite exporter TauE/SafE family protein [Alphaproteobacteria bacterium]